MDCPDVNLIRMYISFVAVLDELTVPNVAVTALLVWLLFNGAVPPKAHPSDPFPPLPVSDPGIPEPAYAVDISNQPFNPDVESIVEPGNPTHKPANVPDHLTSNLETDVLTILNVKY